MHAMTSCLSLTGAFLLASAGLSLVAAEIPAVLPRSDGKPADMSKPVKVFILMGQSNAIGFGKITGGEGSLENAVKNKGKYPYLVDTAGNWIERKDVRNVRVMCSGSGPWSVHMNEWMTIGGGKIGLEIGLGHVLGYVLDEPVMILKSAIGNRALSFDLLPPGAEGYAGNKEKPRKPKAGGEWYAGVQYDGDVRAALDVLADLKTYYPGATKYEVAGFFFWQGEKDCGNGAWADAYEKNLVQFIKDLRMDFEAPNAKFVLATLGEAQKGAGGNSGKVLEAHLAVDGKEGKYKEFKGNVATVYSNPLSLGGSGNGHYSGNAETYMNVGEAMGRAMAELILEQSPKGLTAKGSGSSRPTPGPELRPARKLAAGKQEALNRALLGILVKLSDTKRLKPVPIPLSMTQARVSLVSVKADNTLTFRSDSGKTADFTPDKLKPVDFVNLAVLASQLKPDSPDISALTGVYLEGMGRVELADKKYAEAGADATAKMEAFFE